MIWINHINKKMKKFKLKKKKLLMILNLKAFQKQVNEYLYTEI